MSVVYKCDDVWWQTQFLSVGNSKKPETVHLFHLSSTDVDRVVSLLPFTGKKKKQFTKN